MFKSLVLALVFIGYIPLGFAQVHSYFDSALGLEIHPRPASLESVDGKECSKMEMGQVKKIIIIPSQQGQESDSYSGLQKFQQDSRGFCDIAFHYGVSKNENDFVIHQLRSLENKGSFVSGENNSVGILVQDWAVDGGRVDPVLKAKLTKMTLFLKRLMPLIDTLEASPYSSEQFKSEIGELSQTIFINKDMAHR